MFHYGTGRDLRAAEPLRESTAQRQGQLLHVVEIQSYPTLYGPVATVFDVNEVKRVSLDALGRAYERTPGPDVPYEKYVISGRVASEVASFAKDYDSDLVVISTHGLSGLERALTGSTTEQVIRVVECPVFTVKAFERQLLEEELDLDLEELPRLFGSEMLRG